MSTERVAGRELDAEVAEYVMGWTKRSSGRTTGEKWAEQDWCYLWIPARFNGDPAYSQPLPRYSTSITDAFEVVEKLVADGCTVALSHDGREWSAAFGHIRWGTSDATAATPAHAICLAALGPR